MSKGKSILQKISALILCTIMAGCVGTPQGPIPLNSSDLLVDDTRVGVAMTAMPEVKLVLPGADCLLCIAAAATANSALSKHSKTLDGSDLGKLRDDVIAALREQGVNAIAIDTEIEIAKLPKFKSKEENAPERDFTAIAQTNEVDQLIVIVLNHVGVTRPYASYIATAAPSAAVQGMAFVVDPSDNSYSWYHPIANFLEAEGEWKEPPDYPGITNAFYQVVEQTRDDVLTPLSELANHTNPAPITEAAEE